MANAENGQSLDLAGLTADIVAAYVSKNSVSGADLAGLIAAVGGALRGLNEKKAEPAKPVPPVPVKKTITPDYLISLEDGRQYKALKRHLSRHGLTPDEYRRKWDLPQDYPMVAANYAKRRSELAKAAGLGQQRRKPAEPATPAPAPKAERGAKPAAKPRRPRASG